MKHLVGASRRISMSRKYG